MQPFLAICLLSLMLVISGCSDLILRGTDSTSEKTGKVAARVLLCPLTLCFSELGIATASQREAEQRYVDSLTPEQFERYDARKQQAIGMFLGSGGFRSFREPIPTYQPPPPIQYAPVYQAPPVRPPVNCTTNRVGDYIHTNCY